MLKMNILAVCIASFSCIAVIDRDLGSLDKNLVPLVRNPDFLLERDLSLYTFDIKDSSSLSDTYGKAFIAECDIYTAKHIVEIYDHVGSDVVNLGSTPIQGFMLCRKEHSKNDSFIYMTDRGRIEVWVYAENDNFFDVLCSDNIKPGDSGTPTICAHGNVIGLVSGYYPNSFYISRGGIRGIIAKIPVFEEVFVQESFNGK